MAEVIIATPSIKIGIERGRTITALNIAVFPMVRALPKAPSKLNNRVPINRLTKSGKTIPPGKNKKKVLIIEANNKMAPVTNQCANTLANTKIKIGSPLKRK